MIYTYVGNWAFDKCSLKTAFRQLQTVAMTAKLTRCAKNKFLEIVAKLSLTKHESTFKKQSLDGVTVLPPASWSTRAFESKLRNLPSLL